MLQIVVNQLATICIAWGHLYHHASVNTGTSLWLSLPTFGMTYHKGHLALVGTRMIWSALTLIWSTGYCRCHLYRIYVLVHSGCPHVMLSIRLNILVLLALCVALFITSIHLKSEGSIISRGYTPTTSQHIDNLAKCREVNKQDGKMSILQ